MMKRVLSFWKKHNIFTAGDSVVAGVSGGCDSMCLLHLLHSISSELGINVTAAHFNHHLRGDESNGDEAFVAEYCRSLGIPCVTGSGDVKAYAAEHSVGTEEAARELRYAFFYETAGKLGATKIATAHNADDNLETILLNLTRGAGLKGLCGIPPVRGIIVRPLLPLTRVEIEAYLENHGIPHREDSTNAADDYSRNKLRHRVLPVLRELNPLVCASSVTSSELLREDDKYLTSLAEEYIEKNYKDGRLPAAHLASLPYPVPSRVIRALCPGLTARHVAAVLKLAASCDPSASLSLPGMVLRREYGALVFSPSDSEVTFPAVPLNENSTVFIEPLSLRITCTKTVQKSIIHKSLTTFSFKCDSLYGNISVRPRIEGDSIRLSPKSGRKTLKKLFIEKKIPARRRGAVPVIADSRGPVAVYGMGQDISTYACAGDSVLTVSIEEIKDI